MTNPTPPTSSKSSTHQFKGWFHRSTRQRILTAPLPDPIAENINAIIAIHRQESEDVAPQERLLEVVASWFSRPTFLYLLLGGLGLWLAGDWLNHLGLLPVVLPTFSWAEQGLDAAALLISTGVLIRQNRQESFAEQRTQLMLQLSLLSEKKIAKIIALLEELREDLPNLEQRYDPEAAIMQQSADPLTVLEALKETLETEMSAESE
ncbi:DUF1003 domain-containing protein [Nodosilinea sp. LEGE 07298]|jgi:uncharacterized membrane protein|uniref:DUF1003 domain-containing protein n=1 Tax=Nodosilinea sp. LEGE 07298 TaxID=2777970 RepID=UPI00188267A9|nr:DUF1003 domain-containing protein [Nodosilinea sp. LEGE 07298]MBE9111716.1 DUF1003 domain-containing protein [Nodosilinea sp. LEGE 07298]